MSIYFSSMSLNCILEMSGLCGFFRSNGERILLTVADQALLVTVVVLDRICNVRSP